MRLVVIPAYHEEKRVGEVVSRVRTALPDFQVVVVDDGSLDATSRVAREAKARVLRHPFNLGYGAALQTGYKYALASGASLVVQLDADGQHDPADAHALVEPIERGELDVVIGSRFLGAGDYQMGTLRASGRRFFQALLAALGLRISDPTSGYQALSRSALEFYAGDDFPSDYPDVDVLLAAHRRGLRIGERPVVMRESPRISSMHSGLAPIFYVYKMLLSLWATSSRRRRS